MLTFIMVHTHTHNQSLPGGNSNSSRIVEIVAVVDGVIVTFTVAVIFRVIIVALVVVVVVVQSQLEL